MLGERQAETGTMLRFVSESVPAGAQTVSPGLEDVFLYVYRDEKDV
jgi:hypothetical protein